MSAWSTTYRPEMVHISRPHPAHGDLIIRSAQDCATDYVIARDPAPAQMRYSAYTSALSAAKRWAVRQHIDVWFQDRECDFILLSRHRADRVDPHALSAEVRRRARETAQL